jgi:ragB/susD domain protein
VTDNNFMEKVKQERRIELCFEEHRYFDLRRWMDGNQLREPIIGMKVEENASGLHYTRITVDEARNFKDYMYYHPIPLKVIKESPSIQQNPGW